MIDVVKVKHHETHWRCGDGCCDNYSCESIFTYKGQEYEFEGYSSENCEEQFLRQVMNIEFDVETEYEDLGGGPYDS